MIVHSRDALIPVRDMSALIARLEAAVGGSPALTDDVLKALGFVTKRYPMDSDRYWIVPGEDRHPLPPWCDKITVSLDASLALAERVVGNREWLVEGKDRPLGRVHRVCLGIVGPVYASTPALALCIAILKAKAQGEGG